MLPEAAVGEVYSTFLAFLGRLQASVGRRALLDRRASLLMVGHSACNTTLPFRTTYQRLAFLSDMQCGVPVCSDQSSGPNRLWFCNQWSDQLVLVTSGPAVELRFRRAFRNIRRGRKHGAWRPLSIITSPPRYSPHFHLPCACACTTRGASL